MVREFIMGAYPYILIGLAIAVIAATYGGKVMRDKQAKTEGKDSSEPQPAGEWFKNNGFFVASMCMYAVGFMQWMGESSSSSAISFLCLGSTFLCLGAAGLHKQNNEDKKENDNQPQN